MAMFRQRWWMKRTFLVLEHSHEEGVACFEKDRAAKQEQGRRDHNYRNET
jgi:hypothetical protein